jgi:hypothetical protein
MAKFIPFLIVLFAVTAPLPAQQGQVGGPLAGYVFDRQAHALRPVLGIPGASLLGDSLSFGLPVQAAYVAPGLDSVIVTAADRSLRIFKLTAGTAKELTVNGLNGVPDSVSFSPSGTSAALVAAGRVQVVTGLPNAPVGGPVVDVRNTSDASAVSVRPHPYRGMATDMVAISDDGSLLLVSDSSVRVQQTAGGAQTVMDSVSGALVAFAPGGHDGVVAHPSSAGLVVIRDLGGANQQQAIASASDIASADGVAFSADGGKLYVARSSSGVAVFDLAAKSRTDIACGCVPFGLTQMGTLFRLNDLGSGPLWVLDPAHARIVFVPAKTN